MGKVVVVTGAAGGLGRALAQTFAGAGACIAALDRDAAGAEALAAELRDEGRQALGLACDVSDAVECERALAAVVACWGRIDVLVNNAGISHRSAYRRTDPAVIRRVMEVNFFGAVHCTRAALDALLESRGLIVVISSVAGFAPLIARTGYAASKHALHGFFESLRTEVEPLGLKVMLVCPSFIETGIEKNALAGDGDLARHPQSIVGTRATPDAMASKIHAAAARERRLLLPDAVSRSSWWLSRLAPIFYERLMTRKLGREMD